VERSIPYGKGVAFVTVVAPLPGSRSLDCWQQLDRLREREFMSLTSPQKRRTSRFFFCMSASVILGCATARDPSRTMTQSGIEGTSAPYTEPTLAANAPSRTLFERARDRLEVRLTTGDDIDRLEVADPTGSLRYQVGSGDAADKIVIDLPGHRVDRPKTVSTNDSELITNVKLESHRNNGRLVVDLDDTADVQSDVEQEDGKLFITVKRANPSLAMGGTEAALPSEERADQPALTSLRIEPDAGGRIVADFSDDVDFTLRRTAPSEYVMRLRGVGVDTAAASTVLSQASGSGIRSVRPVMQGEDLLLRIFARPEVTLTPTKERGRIVINSSVGGDDMRAQVSPDAIGAAAPTAAPTAAPVVTPPANGGTGAPGAAGGAQVTGGGGATPGGAAGANTTVGAGGATPDEDELARFLDEGPRYSGRLISLDLQDTDIDNALRIIAEVSNLNIIASDDVTGKVTLRLIDVPWDQALDVILKTNGLDKVQEGNVIRIAPVDKLRAEREALKQAQQAEEELEPLQVRYMRVSYAKASELKPLIDSILTERGQSTYDERTNQIIVKDIARGLRNVTTLVSKLDLRTPQVLLETQIVEANRSLLRDLGSELGFRYLQSPLTGNATGENFPNSVDVGGFLTNAAAGGANPITLLLGSADGTRSLMTRLTALEAEGRVRVISRPAVATTNNRQALIKSVEKIRIRLPSSGVSVATGQGASANGQGGSATETIEVGIVLEVTPQASPDYYVLLDINAKSSTLGTVRSSDGIPSEIERSATSSVLVSSGQTFALGGIYKITDNDNVGGLPYFRDIPFLGTFFRRVTTDNRDEELLFFLTPRIVEGSFDDATMKASA